MGHTSKRPVHLDLPKIKLPIGGIISILHRATGIYLFLSLPFLLYLFGQSLQDAAGYAAASDTCLLYTSPSPRDLSTSRMPSSA